MKGAVMRGTKKAAYQAEVITKLRNEIRELQSELKSTELALQHKDKVIEAKEQAFRALKNKYEEYIAGYAEKVMALEKAEAEYKTAAVEARIMQKTFRDEFEKEIAAVRAHNRREA